MAEYPKTFEELVGHWYHLAIPRINIFVTKVNEFKEPKEVSYAYVYYTEEEGMRDFALFTPKELNKFEPPKILSEDALYNVVRTVFKNE